MIRLFALFVPIALACAAGPAPGLPWTLAAQDPASPGAGPPAPSDLPEPGDSTVGRVVARMQVAAPGPDSFVLHGTLPLPRLPGSAPPPLALLAPGGARPVPAQVDVVTRYPTGEPEVIEVSARVAIAPGIRTGSPVTFDVVTSDAPAPRRVGDHPPAPTVPDEVAALLLNPASGPFGLRARDVFGNVYTLDLRGSPHHPGSGSARVLSSGPAKRVQRLHGALAPTSRSGAGDPLPHLMGVHAYVTAWAGDERVCLDLRVHNGLVAGSRQPRVIEEPAGFIYWDQLELLLPAEWTAQALFDDPFLGEARTEKVRGRTLTVLPLVKPLPGALHMMPPQAQFERRLVLSPRARPAAGEQNPALTGLAFCTPGPGLWSWFAPETARYFPQRGTLCTWERFRRGGAQANSALRATLLDELGALRKLVAAGDSNGNSVSGRVMGWAHPFGAPAAGVTGGGGIVFLEGQRSAASASRHGVERIMLEHRMNVSRQAEAAWNADGDPVGYHEWLDGEGRVPFDFRTNGRMVPPPFKLPSRHGPAPSAHVAAVFERELRPPYDGGSPQQPGGSQPGRESIVAWLPHDGQHMVRYTKNTKALVWLANDAMARDDLMLSAELFLLMFHGSPHAREEWSPGVTLLQYEKHAEAHPGQGAWIGRDQAWGIDSMCAAFSIADDAWRERNAEWYARVARFLLKAAMPSGILQRSSNDKIVGDERYDGAQTYESLFLLHAMRCLNESVLRGRDDALRHALEKLVLRTLDYLYSDLIFATVRAPRPPHQERSGPRAQFAVALRDDYATPPFSDSEHWGPNYLPEGGLAGGVELTYGPALLGYGFLLSTGAGSEGLGNPYLGQLMRGRENRSWEGFVAELFREAQRPSNDNSGNWGSLVGQLQALGL